MKRVFFTTFLLLTNAVSGAASCADAAPPKPAGPAAPASAVPMPDNPFGHEALPVLQKFCYSCHGGEKTKGSVNLAKYKDTPDMLRETKMWEVALRAVTDKEMPPESKPQPSDKERQALTHWIETALKSIDLSKLPKDPGRVTAHRLTRLEYNNTIRDLLGVDTHPADSFPTDGSGGGGFDNNADTLFVPPLLLEKLLETATDVLDQAPEDRLLVSRSSTNGGKREAARAILMTFATRAYRRPAKKEELDRLMTLYDAADKKGASLKDALKRAFRAVLVSPNFLFRIEADPPADQPGQVNDYELASRLSYFIWASMPDDELMALAGAKALQNPDTLARQVKRMLADPKALALTENFCGQWLGIQSFKTGAPPDRKRFPEFTPSLRDAMYSETMTFFDAVIRHNGSLLDLLDSDYTFVNEELAKHYGIPDVKGREMQRVTLTDKNRGGLLCMGSVLTFNSYPLRTSPVLRGKWVLAELLGTPPPPPPPQVAVLPPDDKPKNGVTFRQSLELHRKKAECASCHSRMDPIGFGLENFDPVGRWRTNIADQPVDASGILTTGEKFTGAAELKVALMKKKDDCVRNLAERMLSYALGRGIENYDASSVKAIVEAIKKDDYKGATLVREIALSYPFRNRRGEKAIEK